jgi:hypothetical protein
MSTFLKSFLNWMQRVEERQNRITALNVGVFIIKNRQQLDKSNKIDWEERSKKLAHESGATNSGVWFTDTHYNSLTTDSRKKWIEYLKDEDNYNKFLEAMAAENGLQVYIYNNKVYELNESNRDSERLIYSI